MTWIYAINDDLRGTQKLAFKQTEACHFCAMGPSPGVTSNLLFGVNALCLLKQTIHMIEKLQTIYLQNKPG